MKPRVGEPIEAFEISLMNGEVFEIGATRDRWTMLFVYRGKHCPRCKKFLNKLNDRLGAWMDVLDVVVTSADPREKAQADLDEFGWGFPLGYGLTEPQMRALGLYMSDPLSEAETDRRFAEPTRSGSSQMAR